VYSCGIVYRLTPSTSHRRDHRTTARKSTCRSGRRARTTLASRLIAAIAPQAVTARCPGWTGSGLDGVTGSSVMPLHDEGDERRSSEPMHDRQHRCILTNGIGGDKHSHDPRQGAGDGFTSGLPAVGEVIDCRGRIEWRRTFGVLGGIPARSGEGSVPTDRQSRLTPCPIAPAVTFCRSPDRRMSRIESCGPCHARLSTIADRSSRHSGTSCSRVCVRCSRRRIRW